MLLAAFIATPVRAQSVEDFYAGKVLTLYIGFPAGGGYDLYGRLVARHLGKFIPGQPTIVPVNMEGAGSLRLMNWLYMAAPKDGTVFGTVNHGAPFVPLLGDEQFARFDAREYSWIGSANKEVSVCVAWERTGITNFEQLYEQELIVGSTGPGAEEFTLTRLVGTVLGARLRPITGYAGSDEINFAMERGEVDGRCGWTWSSVKSTRQRWLDEGSINVLLQLALRRHPDLPGVPLIMELVENDEQREALYLILVQASLGRPFLAPPNIPADRAAALRAAFDAMVANPEFLDDAERLRLEINPVSAPEVEALLADAYSTPQPIVQRTRELLR
jgi:tripartite-type tricarboxylate transporter receptor subunit TctC